MREHTVAQGHAAGRTVFVSVETSKNKSRLEAASIKSTAGRESVEPADPGRTSPHHRAGRSEEKSRSEASAE